MERISNSIRCFYGFLDWQDDDSRELSLVLSETFQKQQICTLIKNQDRKHFLTAFIVPISKS